MVGKMGGSIAQWRPAVRQQQLKTSTDGDRRFGMVVQPLERRTTLGRLRYV
jgi:hypothetical protein